MKYYIQEINEHFKARLQRTIQIVTSFSKISGKTSPIHYEFNMIRSQTKSIVWCAHSLNTKCYECKDDVAICKHLLTV